MKLAVVELQLKLSEQKKMNCACASSSRLDYWVHQVAITQLAHLQQEKKSAAITSACLRIVMRVPRVHYFWRMACLLCLLKTYIMVELWRPSLTLRPVSLLSCKTSNLHLSLGLLMLLTKCHHVQDTGNYFEPIVYSSKLMWLFIAFNACLGNIPLIPYFFCWTHAHSTPFFPTQYKFILRHLQI